DHSHTRLPRRRLVLFRTRPPARSTLFPYTTLFRSGLDRDGADGEQGRVGRRQVVGLAARSDHQRQGDEEGEREDAPRAWGARLRSEEHTSELQSLRHLVCRLLLEKKKNNINCEI